MHQSTIKKGHYSKQWEAETNIQLAAPKRQLKVTTLKSHRGILCTSCQAVKVSDDGRGFSFVMFQDYSAVVMNHGQVTVTEKVITEAHNRALEGIQTFIDNANQFYAHETQKAAAL